MNVVSGFFPAKLAQEKERPTALKEAIGRAFTPVTALGFMVFVLLYVPCVVVAFAMRQELGGWKWFGVAFAYQSVLAWTAALLIFQVGRLLGLGG